VCVPAVHDSPLTTAVVPCRRQVKLSFLCAHGPSGKCSNCTNDESKPVRKHVSFEEFMAERKKNCKHDGFRCVCARARVCVGVFVCVVDGRRVCMCSRSATDLLV
jgi:hypothetical protein